MNKALDLVIPDRNYATEFYLVPGAGFEPARTLRSSGF